MRRALLVVLAGALLAGCGETSSPDGTGAGSLPLDGRSPLQQPAARIRVLVQFHRPSLAEAMADQPFTPGRQRAYVSNLHDEAAATQSSLRAKGIKLIRPTLYARVWNGFAATIRARDLPRLQALGLRAEPVRRFFGAASGATARAAEGGTGRPSVALLDTARHGNSLAGILRPSGRVLRIRVGGVRRDPATGATSEYATTDQLLAGLERAVDPNRDGRTGDHVPVALVGVSSPYAGFDDSPEAQAVGGATTLGTLVVAPAGNEGPSAGRLGTIGSPGAAPDALTVGALEGGGAPALPSVEVGLATGEGRMRATGPLLGGPPRAVSGGVAALSGPSQASPKARGRALGAEPLEYFTADAKPRARGRVVVVPARSGARTPALASRAAAASEAGAAALVVCEPDPKRPLPALPEGVTRIPVIGLRGDAGKRALELTPEDGGMAFVSEPDGATDTARLRVGATSSRGPTYALAPKPDLAAPGTAELGGRFVAGTSIAAARVAAVAARLRAAKPKAEPAEIAARLTATAAPRGPLLAAGAGEPAYSRAVKPALVLEPGIVALPRQDADKAFTATAKVTARNTGSGTLTLRDPSVALRGATATVAPPMTKLEAGKTAELTVTVKGTRPAGFLAGTLSVLDVRAPVFLAVGPPPPAPLSPLRLSGSKGVRFTAGALTAKGEAVAVAPLGDLTLQILDADGTVVRDLTPQGGARDLLPGEYAYTLTKEASGALEPGPYRFRATAHGPAGGPATVRTSPSFTVR